MEQKQDITKLGYYLNRAFSGIVEEFDHALHAAGLPVNHARFLILKALENNKGLAMSQRSIAMRLGKDPAAISRTLKLLEADHLIERRAVTGCKNGVSLTGKYYSIRPQIDVVIRKVTTGFCSSLSEDEIEGGLIFLKKILDSRTSHSSKLAPNIYPV